MTFVSDVIAGQSLTSRPRHSFDLNTLKLAVCNTGIGLCKSLRILCGLCGFFVSLTSGRVKFVTWPVPIIDKSMGEKSSISNTD